MVHGEDDAGFRNPAQDRQACQLPIGRAERPAGFPLHDLDNAFVIRGKELDGETGTIGFHEGESAIPHLPRRRGGDGVAAATAPPSHQSKGA
jgi:hypothetical protein